MKTVKTFADRAKDVMKKYPYHKNSATDNESMMDELQNLADEQEAIKKAQGGAQEGAQGGMGEQLFAGGGFTELLRNAVNTINTYADPEEPDVYENVTPSAEYEKLMPTNEEMGIEKITKGPGDTTKVGNLLRGLKGDIQENPENYFNALSGLTPALTNYANLRSVKDAKKVSPVHVKPHVNPKYYDSNPLMETLQQNLASANYSIGQKGSDMDSYIAGLRTVNQDTNTSIGMAELEGQKLNMNENARVDNIITDARKINTAEENQANVDFHQEELDVDQLKRTYRMGIGQNIGGIFKDMADSRLAVKIGKQEEILAKLNAGKNT